MTRTYPRAAALVAVPVMLLVLSGCGGSSTETTTAATTGATAAPIGGGFSDADREKIQACLQAAGISVPTPSGTFRGTPPSGMPTPNGTPPTGRPTDMPGGGTGGGMFADSTVQAALKACGITVPTGRPGGAPTPSATG